jgi:hypothetical protein
MRIIGHATRAVVPKLFSGATIEIQTNISHTIHSFTLIIIGGDTRGIFWYIYK